MQTVLIIDDAPDIRTIGAISLQTSGLDVLQASGGAEGLEIALSQKPDLILLDVMMPGMDGPTTLQEMRARGVTVPIVFLTAKVQGDEMAEYEQMGANAVIPKPFDPIALADQLREIARNA